MTQKRDKSQEIMSDKPREWPYKAGEARDRAAEEAAKIVRLLTPVIEGAPMSEADRIRREAMALISAQSILRHLEAQGAPTRPE